MPPRPNKDRQLKSARNKLRAGERSAKAPSKNIGDQVGGWLGGVAKGVYNYSDSQARTFTNPYINAAGRVIGKNPNLPVSGAKEAITNTAWGVVDVASGPIGRAAGKGVTAVGRAVQSGRVVNPVAAARNLVKGQKVVVHGTPNPLQGKFIQPRAESWGAQEIGKPVVYNFDPRAVKAKSTIPYRVQEYANPNIFRPEAPSNFNAVIGRTPKSSIKTHSATGYKYSESPVSIDKVLKTNKPPEQLAVELQRELRKMGTQMRGNTVKQAVKDAIIRKQNKRLRGYRQ